MILRTSTAMAGIGLTMMALGTFMGWYDPVLFGGLSAFAMPLLGSALTPPFHFYWGLSYGVAILLGFILVGLGWEMKRAVPIWWSAVILLLLALNCPLQIGFSQPTWLFQFLSAAQENLTLVNFANSTNFPIVVLAQPLPSAQLVNVDGLNIDGLFDRWFASVAAMQVGWWFFIEGAIFFVIAAWMLLPDAEIQGQQIKRAFVVVGLFLAFHLLLPVVGEFCWSAGQRAEFAGQSTTAKGFYHMAITVDQWNRLVPRVYQRLGAMAQAENKVNTAESHFYMAQRKAQLKINSEALDEFGQAAQTNDSNWRQIALNQYARTASTMANPLFNQGMPDYVPVPLDMVSSGAGMAGLYWEKAAGALGVNVSENFMGARGYQDSGQYDQSIKLLANAQSGANDPMVLAHIYCSQGDVYALQGDMTNARERYLAAFALLNHNKDYWSVRASKDLTDNNLFR